MNYAVKLISFKNFDSEQWHEMNVTGSIILGEEIIDKRQTCRLIILFTSRISYERCI
jgi:hypothetical protein